VAAVIAGEGKKSGERIGNHKGLRDCGDLSIQSLKTHQGHPHTAIRAGQPSKGKEQQMGGDMRGRIAKRRLQSGKKIKRIASLLRLG